MTANNARPFSRKAHWLSIFGFLGLGVFLLIAGIGSGDRIVMIVYGAIGSLTVTIAGYVAIFDKPSVMVETQQ